MFNRPNLFRSGYHCLVARPSSLIFHSYHDLIFHSRLLLDACRDWENAPQCEASQWENALCGRKGLRFDSPWQCQESQCRLCVGYDPAPFWYSFYVALLWIDFIRFCEPLLC